MNLPRYSGLLAALIVYLGLAVWSQYVIPLDYGPDEPYHMEYVHILSEYGRLPLPSETYIVHHPPSYYLLALPLYKLSGNHIGPLEARPGSARIKNFAPSEITARRLIRPLSILLGSLSVVALYILLVVVGTPRKFRLPLLLLVGALPMFVYVTSVVNSEALSYLWSAATAAWLMYLLYREQPATWQQVAMAGALVGGGLMVRQTSLFVLPGAILIVWVTQTRRRSRLCAMLLFVATVLLVGMWWPLHNFSVSGEFFPNYAPKSVGQHNLLPEMMADPKGASIIIGVWLRNILASAILPDWAWMEGLVDLELVAAVSRLLVVAAVLVALATLWRTYRRNRNRLSPTTVEELRRDGYCVWACLAVLASLIGGILWFCITVDWRAQIGGRYLLNGVPYLLAIFAMATRKPRPISAVPAASSQQWRQVAINSGLVIGSLGLIAFHIWWLLVVTRFYSWL